MKSSSPQVSGLENADAAGCAIPPRINRDETGDWDPEELIMLLEIQRDLAIALLSCANLTECLDLLLASALRLPGFDCGGIYLRDETTGGLRLLAHRGLSEEFVQNALAYPADSPQTALVKSGKLVYAMRGDLPPAIAAAVANEGLEALAVLPLRDRGQVIGSLNVSSHRYPRIESSSRIALESLVAQAEGAIASIREYEARRVAERRLRLAVEGAKLGTWVADFESGAFIASGRAQELHGIAADVPMDVETAMDVIHPDDREMVRLELEKTIRRGEQFSCVYRTDGRSGETRWLASEASFSAEDGGKLLHGIVRDVTLEKQSAAAVIVARDELEIRVAARTAELEQTLGALRLSEEKYRTLHESMMDAFVRVDMDGRIIESNKSYQDMLGYSHDELCHMTYVDLTPRKWHALEHGILISQVLTRGFTDPYEKEYRRKDGTVFPIELRTSLILDADGRPLSMWAIVRDISERKQAERTMMEWNQALECRVAERAAELHASEARFRQLAEATFEGIAVTEDGILVDGNPQLAGIHGYELSEMIGRPVMDFIAPESRALVAERMGMGHEEAYECFGLRKDGTTFPAEVHACMRTWQGRETRVTALRDLTNVKRSASRLHALQTEFEHAQKLGLVSEISAGIIHQIGQPLCAMGANLAAAIAGVGTCHTRHCGTLEIIRDVDADVSRLRDIVVHLRALANPGRANRECFDFNAMVSDVVRLLRHEAATRQVDLTTDAGPDLPLLEGDAVQLSQVVLNLARNAFDACGETASASGSVRIRTRSNGAGGIVLDVSDTGTGIPEELMDGLFAPFFTTKREGLGMGLRLSRTIIHTHGGTIEAFNNPDGGGATFRVFLPVNHKNGYSKV